MPKPKPKIWFDYEYLSSLDNPDAPKELFYLSEPAQKILADFAETLLWPTRWYYQYDDQLEEPPALAFRLREELKVPYHLDDLIPLLDDIEPLLQQLLSAQCCNAQYPTTSYDFVGTDYNPPDDTTVGSGALPDAFLTNPLADYDSSGSIGWDDYSVYLCDAAYRVAGGLETALFIMRTGTTVDLFALARSVVATLLTDLFPGRVDDLIVIAWDALWDLVEAFGSWLSGAPSATEWDAIMLEWNNTVKQQVLCHIAEAVSADVAATDVRADMQSLYTSSDWNAIWTLYPFQRILRKVFEGAEAYEGPIADCTCVETYDFTAVFDWEDGTAQGWAGAEISQGACDPGRLGIGVGTGGTTGSDWQNVKSRGGYAPSVTAAYVRNIVLDSCFAGTSTYLRVNYADATFEDFLIDFVGEQTFVPTDSTKPVKLSSSGAALLQLKNVDGLRVDTITVNVDVDAA